MMPFWNRGPRRQQPNRVYVTRSDSDLTNWSNDAEPRVDRRIIPAPTEHQLPAESVPTPVDQYSRQPSPINRPQFQHYAAAYLSDRILQDHQLFFGAGEGENVETISKDLRKLLSCMNGTKRIRLGFSYQVGKGKFLNGG